MVVSPQLLDELERVLAYPKIRARIEPSMAERLVRIVSAFGVSEDAEPPQAIEVDAQDAYLVGLAAANDALLITGDLGLRSMLRGHQVLSPQAFLELLDRS